MAGFSGFAEKSNVVNNLTSTATDKALSAAKGKELYDNKVQRYGFGGVNSSVSRTITFSGSSNMLLIGFGNSSSRMTLTIVHSDGANNVPIINEILTATAITMTATTGKLEITSSNASTVIYYACVFSGINNFTVT